MQENAYHPTAGTRLELAIENDGFAITENCVDACTIDQLCATLNENTHGQRNLLGVPLVRELAASEPVRNLLEEILGPDCHAVKGIFFNKTPESNWKVAWHQDLTIAVRQRAAIAGFGPWTIKDGVNNVQPPAETLARILAIRIHLDDNTVENGPLRVIPGSHKHGRLSSEQIAGWDKSAAVTCTVPKGGALLMRPLVLHASSACVIPCARRVAHLEFTALSLPAGLQWHSVV
ncbi:MAG: phytanoyl-CoA dioxygenase family protein [Candidatus Acidiferrum sp.]|jgi:ectoine hydroxylase-related dioxygenase (phytanoyl-CoA dioxygenase family)